MYAKSEPLPCYKKEFEKLGPETQRVIILVQEKYKSYWWNPNCKVVCTAHKKVHKFSFEEYTMGAAVGYFGGDSVKQMKSWINDKWLKEK